MSIKVFGYPDIHWSDRDEQALACAERAQRQFKPDITVIGGDLLSCPAFSEYRRQSMQEAVAEDWEKSELIPASAFLARVGRHTKDKVYILEGNHEARVERWAVNLSVLGQSLYTFLSPRRRLLEGLDKRRYKWIPYAEKPSERSYLSLSPSLSVVHGWTYCKHAAQRHLELSRSRSIIFHHTHRMQYVMERDPWQDVSIEAMSAGCLCQLRPIYQVSGAPTQWTHGFWVAYLSEKQRRDYTLYPVSINKGRAIMPNGKEVQA